MRIARCLHMRETILYLYMKSQLRSMILAWEKAKGSCKEVEKKTKVMLISEKEEA